jgi:hypothetical protein
MSTRRWTTLVASTALVLAAPAAAQATPAGDRPAEVEVLVSGLDGAFGSTVGPDGALYVTEGPAGRITRIDPRTGATSTFADCLPQRVAPVGGPTDVAFLDGTAYALVTLVDASVGGSEVSGVYRVEGDTCTPVADLGQWSIDNPPDAEIFLPSGVHYAFEPHGDGFIVTDGHHNRVLHAGLDGRVTELLQLANVVPAGLAVVSRTLLLAEAGPVPHLPEDGRVVAFPLTAPTPPGAVVASGAPLLVDVEPGRRHRLFALAQGHFTPGQEAGAPADPGTGLLLRADRHGGLDVVADGLDQPNSLEVIRDTAYVVTLGGDVLRIHGLAARAGHR